jgi:phosphoribosyl-ATP pyrophosphohydrolase
MAEIDGSTLDRLYAVIESRRGADPATSYTAALFAEGSAKIAKKLGEEAFEAAIEGVRGDRTRLIAESADLLYHLLVLWADRRVAPVEVWHALEARSGISGIEEKRSRGKSRGADEL